MKYFFLFLILLVLIPCASIVLILTSPFICVYKIKELNKPKKKSTSIGAFDFLKQGSELLKK